jgi:hypothetical protein
MTPFQQRLRWVVDNRADSARDLARKAGLKSEGHVNTMLTNPIDVSLSNIEKIATGAGVSAAWLAFGHGAWDDKTTVPHELLEAIDVGNSGTARRWSPWTVDAVVRNASTVQVRRSVSTWASVLDRWEALLSRAIEDDATRDASTARIKV